MSYLKIKSSPMYYIVDPFFSKSFSIYVAKELVVKEISSCRKWKNWIEANVRGANHRSSIPEPPLNPLLFFILFRYYWIFSLCITFSFLSSVLLHWCKDHSILSPIASHHDLLNFVSVRIIISLPTLMYEFVRCTTIKIGSHEALTA